MDEIFRFVGEVIASGMEAKEFGDELRGGGEAGARVVSYERVLCGRKRDLGVNDR